MEYEEDLINLCKGAQDKIKKETTNVHRKIEEVMAARQKMPEIVRLNIELKRIEKEKGILKLIEL